MALELSRIQGSAESKSTSTSTWLMMQACQRDSNLYWELRVRIEASTFVNVVIDGRSMTVDDIFCGWISTSHMMDAVLAACRQKFVQTPPRFWSKIYAQVTLDGISLEEVEAIDDIELLPHDNEILGGKNHCEPLEMVPLSDMEVSQGYSHFLPPNVRVVKYRDSEFVAKGPIYASHVKHFITELRNVMSLPRHPNIIARPSALACLNEEDRRICGFLMPVYQRGNLDEYSQACHNTKTLSLVDVLRWFRETVNALMFLCKHRMWHGDLKPDNLLVTETGSVCLTDFARAMATSVTASPEVQRHCRQNGPVEDVYLGVPSEWPLCRIMASEVYSLGRTIFLVMTAQSMMKIYQRYGWISEHPFPTSFAFPTNCNSYESRFSIPVNMAKALVLDCVQQDPEDRPTFESLLSSIAYIETGWCADNILLQAHKERTTPML